MGPGGIQKTQIKTQLKGGEANGNIIRNIDSLSRNDARLGVCFLYEKVTWCFGAACTRGLCRRSYGCGIYLEPTDSSDRASEKYGQAVLPPRLYRILVRCAVFAYA